MKKGVKSGPHTMKEMREKVFIGELAPEDMIWTAGMAGWAPAKEIKAFFPGPKDAGNNNAKNPAVRQGGGGKEGKDPKAEEKIGFYALIAILAAGVIIVGLYHRFFT